MVRVPVPAAPSNWVVHLLGMEARQTFDAKTSVFLTVGAVLVTVDILIPGYGILGTVAALAIVIAGFGELLRRGSQGDWTDRPAMGISARLWRGLTCLGAAGAMVLPLVASSRSGIAPRVTPSRLAIAMALVCSLPLLMLATYGLRGSVTSRVQKGASMAVRHPLAVLATPLRLPASVVGIEASMIVMTRIGGAFDFLVLDLLPIPASVHPVYGVPYIGANDYRTIADGSLWSIYFNAIGHGHSLVSAIPTSLVLDVTHHFDPIGLTITTGRYQTLRIFFTLLIATGMLSVLAIQARWLGLLSTMDVRRTPA